MNERIKELVGEAKFMAEESINMKISANESLYAFAEEFAELIVRECADILDPNGAYAEKYKYAHVPGPNGLRTPLTSKEFENMQSAQKLREHFGVEE